MERENERVSKSQSLHDIRAKAGAKGGKTRAEKKRQANVKQTETFASGLLGPSQANGATPSPSPSPSHKSFASQREEQDERLRSLDKTLLAIGTITQTEFDRREQERTENAKGIEK